MPARCQTLIALGTLLLASQALAGEEVPTRYWIPPGQEEHLLRMTNPGPKGFPGGYRLQGVQVERSRALLTYQARGDRTIRLLLVHPSQAETPIVQTQRFAIRTLEGPASPEAIRLAKALAALVRRHEATFQWSVSGNDDPTPSPTDGSVGGAPPGMWMPEIPPDGQSIAFLGRPRHQVAPKALVDHRAIEDLLRQGKTREAADRAMALAVAHRDHRPTVRAAASLLRMAGEGGRARDLLRPLLGSAPDRTEEDLLVEYLASLELAGDDKEAEDLCSRVPNRPPACCRAEAWTLLAREGRVSEVVRRVGPLSAPVSLLCEAVLHLRLAIALDDPEAVEAAGKAATNAFPQNPDLWFLWGNYYWNKSDLVRAIPPWDRLMALRPDYPSALGLYISTYLMSGRLKQETIPEWSRKADAAPDDPVVNYLAAIAWYYKANSTHDPEDYRRSIPYFERVVARIPKDQPRAWMYLGMAHFFTGNQPKAEKILQNLEPYTWHEPDINYCRSLVYRKTDLPRAIAEMEKFLQVFLMEGRLNFGPAKLKKAQDDLEAMKRGEIPSYWLPPDSR